MEQNYKTAGDKNLTIGDIAEELGLSKTTISRAISGKGRISEETRARVQEYIKAHDYKPNVVAKGLAQSKTYNIGVVLPADANLSEIPFFQGCLMGICEAAAAMDYDVVVTTVKEDDITFLRKLIQNQKVDGLVLTRALVNDLPAGFLKETKMPFVVIGTTEDSDIMQVDSDHITACCELTSILLMTGCHSLSFIAGNQNHIVNRSRYGGYLKAFRDMNVLLDESLIHLDMINNVLIDRAVKAVMERKTDCIVCSDDLICSRVLTRLEDAGYSIPGDIKVASFYNNMHLETHNPPITAININVDELGKTAANKLLRIISGEDENNKTLVNYEILLRKSTK